MSTFLDRNIALIGFMTAGKSLVGAALCRLSGLPFLDIDLLVERLEQASVQQIFETKGEPYFRRLEAAVFRDLCQGSGQIIACGGGTTLLEENRQLLRTRCITVWLRVSEREALARLEQPGSPRRPLLGGLDPEKVISRLLPAREAGYREADHTVETDGRGVEEVAREIALRVGVPVFEA